MSTDTVQLRLRTDPRHKPAGLKSGKYNFKRDNSGAAIPLKVPRTMADYLLRNFQNHLEVATAKQEYIEGRDRTIELPPSDDAQAPAPAAFRASPPAKPKADPSVVSKDEIAAVLAAAKTPEAAARAMAMLVGLDRLDNAAAEVQRENELEVEAPPIEEPPVEEEEDDEIDGAGFPVPAEVAAAVAQPVATNTRPARPSMAGLKKK